MRIVCQNCGKTIEVPSGHPPRLNIPVITLCDTLVRCSNVLQAAKSLGCSRAYIYRELKAIGKKPKDFTSKSIKVGNRAPSTVPVIAAGGLVTGRGNQSPAINN